MKNQLLALGFATVVAIVMFKGSLEYVKYRHIPTCGGTDLPLISLIGAFRYLFCAVNVLEEGYHNLRNHPFKIAQFTRWMVIVASPELIGDVRKAPEDVLSFHDATSELLQMPYTLGASVAENPYHIPIIQRALSRRNVLHFCSVMKDEIEVVIKETLTERTERDSWVSISPSDFTMALVGRVNGRVLSRFYSSLRSCASKLFPGVHMSIARVAELLDPVIEAKAEKSAADSQESPEDLLGLLLKEAQGSERWLSNLARRLMAINFAGMHTTSTTFIQAILHLAESPDYALGLREEVEALTLVHGWTINSLKEMKKIERFLTESQRINPLGAVLMQRVVRKRFTFSDGTSVPVGTTLGVAVTPVHHDSRNYPAGGEFRPFGDNDKQMPPTELQKEATFLAFGQGRHACPGRFFASLEMKLLLAQLVLLFDLKMPESSPHRPDNVWIGSTCIPNPSAKVLVRRRNLET
ncbi:hypothetical protein E4T56_gene20567 [Termitomyces sp. T112]|nr:hypothetical protein E4T56_gene20567 [Termitomyces sp. T112]